MVVGAVYVIGAVMPLRWLQIGSGTALVIIGLWKLYRSRHPTWVGMCVNSWDLILWSWLMATAALVAWVVYHFIGLAVLKHRSYGAHRSYRTDGNSRITKSLFARNGAE